VLDWFSTIAEYDDDELPNPHFNPSSWITGSLNAGRGPETDLRSDRRQEKRNDYVEIARIISFIYQIFFTSTWVKKPCEKASA